MCRYLASKYPEKGLGGTDAKSRAAVDNWMEAEAHNLDPYTGVRQGFDHCSEHDSACVPLPQRLQSAVRRAMTMLMPCRVSPAVSQRCCAVDAGPGQAAGVWSEALREGPG